MLAPRYSLPATLPDAVGCAACHLGNPFSLDAAAAHAGMVLVPRVRRFGTR